MIGRRVALALLFALATCNHERALPGKGVSLHRASGDIVWNINVGVLNDSEIFEYSSIDIRALVDRTAQRFESLAPGMRVNGIVDQPLEAEYIMENSIRAKEYLRPKWNSSGPVLWLGDTANARETNLAKVAEHLPGAMGRLAALQAIHNGTIPLREGLTSSHYVWSVYIKEQVRYDVVISSAPIFPDDLRRQSVNVTEQGLVAWDALPANGRHALEGSAGLVSFFDMASADPDGWHESAAAEDRLLATFLALLIPVRADSTLWSVDEIVANGNWVTALEKKGCADCETYWDARLQYLAGLNAFYRDGADAGCDAIMKYRNHHSSNPMLILAEDRESASRAGREGFQSYCGKNE